MLATRKALILEKRGGRRLPTGLSGMLARDQTSQRWNGSFLRALRGGKPFYKVVFPLIFSLFCVHGFVDNTKEFMLCLLRK